MLNFKQITSITCIVCGVQLPPASHNRQTYPSIATVACLPRYLDERDALLTLALFLKPLHRRLLGLHHPCRRLALLLLLLGDASLVLQLLLAASLPAAIRRRLLRGADQLTASLSLYRRNIMHDLTLLLTNSTLEHHEMTWLPQLYFALIFPLFFMA